jgi:hypothetical protein
MHARVTHPLQKVQKCPARFLKLLGLLDLDMLRCKNVCMYTLHEEEGSLEECICGMGKHYPN